MTGGYQRRQGRFSWELYTVTDSEKMWQIMMSCHLRSPLRLLIFNFIFVCFYSSRLICLHLTCNFSVETLQTPALFSGWVDQSGSKTKNMMAAEYIQPLFGWCKLCVYIIHMERCMYWVFLSAASNGRISPQHGNCVHYGSMLLLAPPSRSCFLRDLLLSYGDCLEVKREYYENSSCAGLCDTMFTVHSTLMWAVLTGPTD